MTFFPSTLPSYKQRMAAFSYVEILVAIVLISIALVPAIEALGPGLHGAGIHQTEAGRHYHLTAKLEEVLALKAAPAESLLRHYETRWGRSVEPIFNEYSF